MKAEELSPDERAKLEVTLPTALELCRLGLATMIDIRQSFEIELDGGEPEDSDAKTPFTMINKLQP